MLTQNFIMIGFVPEIQRKNPYKYKELYPIDAKNYINQKNKKGKLYGQKKS